ncbi:MAG TPA: TetR/AcrR family transcriptional regulator [Solirubrobacterales bacterium]|nr:TetR/AcrR family transcriptional regulator [Solirubrobacterales bacterium]
MNRRGLGSVDAFLDDHAQATRGDTHLAPSIGSGADGGGAPRRLMVMRRRGQILRGALDVFGEKGFAEATVQDLIDASGTSRATFYKYFSDREACVAALSDAVLAWLEMQARDAIDISADDWPTQVRAVTERLVGLLTQDRRVARLCGIEAMLVSPEVRARQRVGFDALAEGLRRGRAQSRCDEWLPTKMEDFLVAGGVSLATRSVFRDLPSDHDLGPRIAQLVLIPYLGAARASKLVRGI